jgi:hypothetical protein
VQGDVGTVEADEEQAFGTSYLTPGEKQRCQPRHPDEAGPVEAHDKRLHTDREDHCDQAHVEPQEVEERPHQVARRDLGVPLPGRDGLSDNLLDLNRRRDWFAGVPGRARSRGPLRMENNGRYECAGGGR